MVESIGVYLALKITNHKHHLILKLGQINPKFETTEFVAGRTKRLPIIGPNPDKPEPNRLK